MATLAKLMVQLGLDDQFSSKMNSVAGNLTKVGAGLTAAVTLPLAAIGIASVKMASDLNENINKVNVVFGESATAVQSWSTTTATSLGISRNEALQATGSFGNLLTNFGLTQDAAAGMSMDIVKLAADLGSFNNLPTAQVLDAIRSGLVGESEPLRQLGIDVSDATVKAKALALGLWDGEGALSASARATTVLALVTEQSGNAYNDFAETSSGAANQTKILRAQLADAGATLGTQLLPLLISFTTKLNELIAGYNGLSPRQQKIIEGMAVFAAIIGPLAIAIGFVITHVMGFATALGLIIAPLTSVITGVLALGPLLMPIVLGLGALKAAGFDLSDMFVSLKNTITGFVTSSINFIRTFATTALATFTLIKTGATTAFTTLVSNALSSLSDLWASGVSRVISIKNSFAAAWGVMKSEASDAFTGMASDLIGIVDGLAGDVYSGAFNAGYQVGNGIIAGIAAIWDSVVSYAGSLADAVLNRLKGPLGFMLGSPSKATTYMGEMLGAGLVEGMAGSERKVSAAAGSMAGSTLAGMATNYNGGISINVSGAGDPNAVADRVFARFVREMALTTGGV